MSSSEEKRENGSVMVVIGWVLMMFAFLVMFFHPAAIKLGESRIRNHCSLPGSFGLGVKHYWNASGIA